MKLLLNYTRALSKSPVLIVKTAVLKQAVLGTAELAFNRMVNWLDFNVVFNLLILLLELSDKNIGISFGC